MKKKISYKNSENIKKSLKSINVAMLIVTIVKTIDTMIKLHETPYVKKLSAHFNVKDMTKFEQKYDIRYFGTCLKHNCKF